MCNKNKKYNIDRNKKRNNENVFVVIWYVVDVGCGFACECYKR